MGDYWFLLDQWPVALFTAAFSALLLLFLDWWIGY